LIEGRDMIGKLRFHLIKSIRTQKLASIKKAQQNAELLYNCDPAGARTRDPLIKSQMLYRIMNILPLKATQIYAFTSKQKAFYGFFYEKSSIF